jgi:hypothetical protein
MKEAWHLQQAIDSSLGHPQMYASRKGTSRETVVVDFFFTCTELAAATLGLFGHACIRVEMPLLVRIR